MRKGQAARWERHVTTVFANELGSRRPNLTVIPQRRSSRVAAADWRIEDSASGEWFSYGCVTSDGSDVEALNVEIPPQLRRQGLATDLRHSLVAALTAAKADRLVFDAGQDGAIIWARTLPNIEWAPTMTSKLPEMIADAVEHWPNTQDVSAMTAALAQRCDLDDISPSANALRNLDQSERQSLVSGTHGPRWFVDIDIGTTTVQHRDFKLGLSEYVLTRRDHWRGALRL